MPYNESAHAAKLREVRNNVEVILDGFNNGVHSYEMSKEDYQWLYAQAEQNVKTQAKLTKFKEWLQKRFNHSADREKISGATYWGGSAQAYDNTLGYGEEGELF